MVFLNLMKNELLKQTQCSVTSRVGKVALSRALHPSSRLVELSSARRSYKCCTLAFVHGKRANAIDAADDGPWAVGIRAAAVHRPLELNCASSISRLMPDRENSGSTGVSSGRD